MSRRVTHPLTSTKRSQPAPRTTAQFQTVYVLRGLPGVQIAKISWSCPCPCPCSCSCLCFSVGFFLVLVTFRILCTGALLLPPTTRYSPLTTLSAHIRARPATRPPTHPLVACLLPLLFTHTSPQARASRRKPTIFATRLSSTSFRAPSTAPTRSSLIALGRTFLTAANCVRTRMTTSACFVDLSRQVGSSGGGGERGELCI